MTVLVVVVGALVVPLPRDPGAALPTTYVNPPIDDATADPFVLDWGQRSYAYVAGEGLPAYVTGDLATWTAVGDVLPAERFGRWMAGGITAPAVAVFPDDPGGARFVLWFTATDDASGRRCIGVATAAAPTGPFDAADEPLLCPPGGARDPSPVPAAGGGPTQLVFRTDGGRPGIYAQRLGPDGLTPAPDPPTPLLLDDATTGRASRPAIVRTGDEALLLFTSTTAPDDDAPRSIGRARCTLAGAGAEVTGCTRVPGGRHWVVGDEVVESPGAPQVFGEATDRWLVYDAYEPGACATGRCTGERRMHVDKLCLEGMPAGGGRPTVPRTGAPGGGRQGLGRAAACRRDVGEGWVATWAAGIMPASSQFAAQEQGFADQTVRQMVHTSVGGEAVRVRLSNTFGTGPLHVGRATVGLATEPAGSAAAVQPRSQRPLTFGGSTTVVVPPGGDVVSDAVTLDVPPDHDLAVNVWYPEPTGPPSGHLVALETSYVGPGDLVDDPGPGFTGAGGTTTESAFFVSAVEVLVDDAQGTVVLLGDSLTDGAGSVPDAEQRWSDHVVDRLVADGPAGLGVVNVGIAGNPLLPDAHSTSPSALERFDHDVLAQVDVDTVIVLLGTNDLLGHLQIGPAVVDGLRQLVARAHAAGVRVVGVTVPPLAGSVGAATPAAIEQARTDVNARIRGDTAAGGLGYDAVVDMDAALRDPADPHRMHEDYAWFGGLHPNDVGHEAMAAAVDLAELVPASAGG